jgi:hypothetical protein
VVGLRGAVYSKEAKISMTPPLDQKRKHMLYLIPSPNLGEKHETGSELFCNSIGSSKHLDFMI